jgi:hypothetical protein
MNRLGLIGAFILATGCSDSTPATPTPTYAQIGGVWRGTARTNSVTGGECFASTFTALIGGSSTVTAAITQAGAQLTSVTITDQASGGSCQYSGTVGQSAIQLTWQSCTASNVIGARCPSSGLARDIKMQSSSVSATVSGTTITGTEADLYNVFVANTSTPVGTLSINSSFTVTKQ